MSKLIVKARQKARDTRSHGLSKHIGEVLNRLDDENLQAQIEEKIKKGQVTKCDAGATALKKIPHKKRDRSNQHLGPRLRAKV